MIIYQVLPRLWGNGKLSDWGEAELGYLRSLGVSHVWFTGIPRHASGKDFVKGDPGCPYAIEDYYDINPYLADRKRNRMAEFESLISRTHAAGLGVIIDFVPNHVAREYNGDLPLLDWCDADWTDTRKIDYGAPDTRDKLCDILAFWASKGVDGVRCDMVELVPPDFFAMAIPRIKSRWPDFRFIGEVYDMGRYREYIEWVGFDLLYDKSGLYDTLMAIDNGWRSAHDITLNWQRLSNLQPRMLNFLENHDEQRLQHDNYAALTVSALFNSASFLLYFGQEVGERAEGSERLRTSIFDYEQIPSVQRLVRHIRSGAVLPPDEALCLQRHRSILRQAARIQSWLNFDLCFCNTDTPGFDQNRHFAFLRYPQDHSEAPVLAVCNFSPVPARFDLRVPASVCALSGWPTPSVPVEIPAHEAIIL